VKALLQRVSQASVSVDGAVVAGIDRGLLVFLGLDRADNKAVAAGLMDKLLNYRLFPDARGRMNLSVRDIAGDVLLVSQFTLSADTRKGLRPSFSGALSPREAEQLYGETLALLRDAHPNVAAGVFAADMQVALVNDGPVTFLLEMDSGC
jgi:D-tyrosyl-tRNA(Tyr) deacylase